MTTTFTATEQTVLDALITHSSLHEEVTLTDLADQCHVAKSTVIKTIQKLGFQGYRDFAYTYRLRSSVQADRLLSDHVVAGDFDQAAQALASCFWEHRAHKNVIYLLEESTGPAAAYMSRKLGMFDVFAPCSYDRILLDRMRLAPGFVMVLPRVMHGSSFGVDESVDITCRHAKQFRAKGFQCISISDMALLQESVPADVRIDLAPSPLDRSTGVDLYTSNILMLFEHALSLLAARIVEEKKSMEVDG